MPYCRTPLDEIPMLVRHGPMPLTVGAMSPDLDVHAIRMHINEAQLHYRTGQMWPSTRVPPFHVSSGWLWVSMVQEGVREWYLYTTY